MSLIKKILIIFFLLLPISNSFGAMVTYVQKASVADDSDHIQGIEFNVEGTKMFTISRVAAGDNKKTNINLYNLSRPFDVSSIVYAGDDERSRIEKVVSNGPETGHTDNIIITIGYLPNKKTNYAFKINGSDNLGSEYKISKNINDFEIDFKLNNQDVLKPNIIDEAMVNLSRIF